MYRARRVRAFLDFLSLVTPCIASESYLAFRI